MANKKNGKWFYIGGAALIGVAILGKIGASDGSSRTDKITYSPPLNPPLPNHGQNTTPPPSPRPIKSDVVVAPAAQASAPKPASTPPSPVAPVIKEPNPPSDNFVPRELVLTRSTSFPINSGGVQTGLTSIPAGTKVKLIKITGYDVLIEYEGSQKSISAYTTDILEQMLGTAN